MERNESKIQEYINKINKMYSNNIRMAWGRVGTMLRRDHASGLLTDLEYKELSVYNYDKDRN